MTKGQRAMAVARLSNLDKTQDQLSAEMGITRTRISEANTVLKHAPDLADGVMSGATPLNQAYEEAQRRKERANSAESLQGWFPVRESSECSTASSDAVEQAKTVGIDGRGRPASGSHTDDTKQQARDMTVMRWVPASAFANAKADEPIRMVGKDGKSRPTKYTPCIGTSWSDARPTRWPMTRSCGCCDHQAARLAMQKLLSATLPSPPKAER